MENSIEINRKLANNLTHFRKAAGLTQAELAEKINYSDKSISKWESGNGVPDVYVLIQLADLYGVTVDTLLGDGAPVRVKKKTRGLHALIMLLCSGIIWLAATFFFVVMSIFFPERHWWLAFLYAILATSIVTLVFGCLWKYKTANFISVTVIIWIGLTCLYLTIKFICISNGAADRIEPLWTIFLFGIPLQVLEVLWSFFRFVFKKQKKLVVVHPIKEEKQSKG